jgi:hypothetical protein
MKRNNPGAGIMEKKTQQSYGEGAERTMQTVILQGLLRRRKGK